MKKWDPLEGCAHFSSSLAVIHAHWLRSPTPLQFVLRVATNCTVLQIKKSLASSSSLFKRVMSLAQHATVFVCMGPKSGGLDSRQPLESP